MSPPAADHLRHCEPPGKLPSLSVVFNTSLLNTDVPKSHIQALQHPGWLHAMQDEMKALQQNHTWSPTDLPAGKKAVGCKWVYSVKFKADGSIDRLKVRLVAKGYTQTPGVDYEETFSTVAKIHSVKHPSFSCS